MSDLDDDDIIWDDVDLAELESQAKAAPKPRTSLKPTTSYTQRNLYGQPVAAPAPKAGPSRAPPPPAEPKGPETVVIKRWDRATFQRTGWGGAGEGKGKKGKGKARAFDPDDEFYDSYTVEDDVDLAKLYDDPDLDPEREPPPMKLAYDAEAAKSFVYPLNKPKRDYQFNIVRKALYTNVLCALPTGLGKTFIAAVVMLNFHRWFPQGKIIFMAPTRPLVDQQIGACHGIAGIPASHAALITGKETPVKRGLAYKERSLFYGTPQTFVNDLKTGRLDPTEVICVVVDEAHKASGDYAYCGVVRYLMTKNPHFRLLALTATPGSKSEAVQSVIDNLHIGCIEIRSEESLDLRQYIHKKEVVERVVPVTGDLQTLRDGLIEVMKPSVKRCHDAGLINNPDAGRLKPFTCQMAMKGASGAKWAYPVLSKLRQLAQAMQYLLEQSITQCVEQMEKAISSKGHKDDGPLQRLVNQAKVMRNVQGYVSHPKLDTLRSLLIEHFSNDDSGGTRIMVFCSFRAVVEEIVAALNEQAPLIRASRFVGQGTDKDGGKGFAQKEQQAVINKFRAGEYNTIVATSIGEEGLDIGEVDLIVCYDSNKSPIRMLQRVGRTGRARRGKIVVLLTEGRDESNWRSAQDGYADVQSAILSGRTLELYADCERLLPKSIQPTPVLEPVDATPFNPEELTISDKGKKAAAVATGAAKGTKRKRDYVPDGAETGFRKVSDLVTGGASTSRQRERPESTMQEREEAACLDDEELVYLDANWRRRPPPTSQLAGLHDDVPLESKCKSGQIGSSMSHARMRRALDIGLSLTDLHELGKWKDRASAHFREARINWWPSESKGTAGDRGHASCRRPTTLRVAKPALERKAAKPEPPKVDSKVEDIRRNEDGEILFAMHDDALALSSNDDLPDADDPALLFSDEVSRRLASRRSANVVLPRSPALSAASSSRTGTARSNSPARAPTQVIEIESDDEDFGVPIPLDALDEEETGTVVHTTPEPDDDEVVMAPPSPELGNTWVAPAAAGVEEVDELDGVVDQLDDDGDAVMHDCAPPSESEAQPELLFAVGAISSDDPVTSPVGSPAPAHIASPSPAPVAIPRHIKRRSSHDNFEDLDDDLFFAEIDLPGPASIAEDNDLMPPPPLSAAPRRGPRELSANRSVSQQRSTSNSLPRKTSLSMIEASPSLKRLKSAASVDVDESSSPQIVLPGRRANQPRIIPTSETEDDGAPPVAGPSRLVRKPAADASRPTKKRVDGPQPTKKSMKVALHKHDLFDVEAIDDDASGHESSEVEESENESDRAFVDQSIEASDGSVDMQAIYRESMMSQAPGMGFTTAVNPRAFRMRYVGGFDPEAVDPDDTFERDSFCASDSESLVYEEESSQALSL